MISSCALGEAEEAALEYSITPFGPTQVFQGYGMRFGVSVKQVSEKGEIIALSVEGLPEGAACSFEFWQGNRVYRKGSGVVHLKTDTDTPPGKYELKVLAVSEKTKVERSSPFPITVIPAPKPLPKAVVTENPPIPLVGRWEQQMRSWGRKHSDAKELARKGLWEGNVWYYDGQRVYYQIADYTGDPSWTQAAALVEKLYRDGYLLKHKGRLPGWRVFPHGLLEDYRHTEDELSKEAALLLANNSAYMRRGGGVSAALSRETAYCLGAYLVAEAFGAPRHAKFGQALDFALGHLEQWFVSRNFLEHYPKGSMPPFMVGLTCEALIQYYQSSKDPRIPHAVKTAVDWLWDHAWIDANQSFYYRNADPYNPDAKLAKGAPDLNLMIAPAFAWLYRLTGDPKYRGRGDKVFAGGVKGAWLGGGKQFTQSYRWSFDYVQWRRDIPVPDDKESPVIAGLTVKRDDADAIIVSWSTNEPAVMQLRYGDTPNCAQGAPPSRYLVTTYQQVLTGLPKDKRHHLRVSATDASGNVSRSEVRSF